MGLRSTNSLMSQPLPINEGKASQEEKTLATCYIISEQKMKFQPKKTKGT